MAKQKSLEQLRAEKEQVEKRLAQEQHKLERLENRKKYLEKGERQKRTHRLCNLGGTIESLAPEVKNLTRTEMTELMEHIFGLPEVQRAVRHMEITLRNSGKNMRKKFCSTRLLKMPLMKWESRSCPRSKSCRQGMRNCWKKRKRPMPSTGVLVRKCGSF